MSEEPAIREKLHTLVQDQLESHDQEVVMQEFDMYVDEGIEAQEAFNTVVDEFEIDIGE